MAILISRETETKLEIGKEKTMWKLILNTKSNYYILEPFTSKQEAENLGQLSLESGFWNYIVLPRNYVGHLIPFKNYYEK